MMEPETVRRYARHAESLGRAIDDPEAARQALEIVALFQDAVNANIIRLRVAGDASLGQLAAALGTTRQAVSQRWPKRPLHTVFPASERPADVRPPPA